jgi:hypothetical protein
MSPEDSKLNDTIAVGFSDYGRNYGSIGFQPISTANTNINFETQE